MTAVPCCPYLLIGGTDHAGLSDSGDLVENLFDLTWVDVVAAVDDEVLDPVDDQEVSVFIQMSQIAGAEPPLVIEHLGGGLGLLTIPRA